MLKLDNSIALFNRAIQRMPGGVNSPVRAFKSVGGTPPFIRSGKGSFIEDEDGNSYLDFVCSWGPLILGHANPAVVQAAQEACARGSSFGAPTRGEVDLCEAIIHRVPSVEMVRLVNSGTEAAMSALRLARGFTGRDLVLKFEGCYHGHSDGLLAKAGSGLATFGIPDAPGVPASFTAETLVLPYNNLDRVHEVMSLHGEKVAAIIVEPIAGNMGVIPPVPGFLDLLRDETNRNGSLLIFDEVITGFRVGAGGAQKLYGVLPDLTVLGKIIGGGFPLAAYGGRKEIMEMVAPSGPVYQAGTLSGNPVATAAGLATLKQLTDQVYADLEREAAFVEAGILKCAADHPTSISVHRVGSMMTVFFASQAPQNYEDVRKCSATAYARLHQELLARGFYLPPSAYEALFISTMHAHADLERFLAAFTQML